MFLVLITEPLQVRGIDLISAEFVLNRKLLNIVTKIRLGVVEVLESMEKLVIIKNLFVGFNPYNIISNNPNSFNTE